MTALVPTLLACGERLATDLVDVSTFDRLQTQVFDVYCVGCHAAGHPYAAQSELVLQAGAAFEALVGAESRNLRARSENLLRVRPGDPDASFLLRKLRWSLDPEYGQPMPLGGPPPLQGQLEFTRRWILGGAPRTGEVADPTLLEDTTPQDVSSFMPIPAPQRGYQIHLDTFAIPPNGEREIFAYKRVGNAQEEWINRLEIAMRPNTHHFILYALPPGTPRSAIPEHDVIRDLYRPDGSRNSLPNMAYRQFLGGADYRFPQGVALRLPANSSLDLNSHYVNGTASPIQGEVYTNLHTVPRDEVQREAFPLFLNNLNISLPPGQRTTVSRTFLMSEPVAVFFLTSHMHQKGERFRIRVVGGRRHGEVIYEATTWDLPDMTSYPTPIELNPGEGLRSEVTYFNPTDRTVTFGLSAEDEMSVMIGYYYCLRDCESDFVASMVHDLPATSSLHAH